MPSVASRCWKLPDRSNPGHRPSSPYFKYFLLLHPDFVISNRYPLPKPLQSSPRILCRLGRMRLISIKQRSLSRWRRRTTARRRRRYRALLDIGVSIWVVVALFTLASAAALEIFAPSMDDEVRRTFFGLVATFLADFFAVLGLSICERFRGTGSSLTSNSHMS